MTAYCLVCTVEHDGMLIFIFSLRMEIWASLLLFFSDVSYPQTRLTDTQSADHPPSGWKKKNRLFP